MVREAAEQLAGEGAVVQVNTQDNPRLADRFQVQSIPTLLIIRRGRIIDTLSGTRPLPAIISWFRGAKAR